MLHSDSCKNDSAFQCKNHYLFRAGQIDGITLKSGFQIKSFLLGLVEVYWLKAYPKISVTGKTYFEFDRLCVLIFVLDCQSGGKFTAELRQKRWPIKIILFLVELIHK